MILYIVKLYNDIKRYNDDSSDIETYIYKDRKDADTRLYAEYSATKDRMREKYDDEYDVEYDKDKGYFNVIGGGEIYKGRLITKESY